MKRNQAPRDWQNEMSTGASEERLRYQPTKKLHKAHQTNITFFLARSTHARLKQMAQERNLSLQQLLAVAVDKLLAEAGEPTFKVKDD
jgi:hypothetical protein